VKLPVCFGPFHFSGVMLGLEMLVAFGSAELEDLAIISNESHAMAWVNGRRAKVALLDPHWDWLKKKLFPK
jgi:hypothetical protein